MRIAIEKLKIQEKENSDVHFLALKDLTEYLKTKEDRDMILINLETKFTQKSFHEMMNKHLNNCLKKNFSRIWN